MTNPDFFSHLYSVRDRVTGEYSAPYLFVSADDMKRKIAVAYQQNPFANDLEVYSVGMFNHVTGKLLTAENSPIFYATVTAIIKELTENA